jgi:hypothetical protein
MGFPSGVDWESTTFEGARREQLRRWAALPLDRVIAALEEMERLSHAWTSVTPSEREGQESSKEPFRPKL